MAIYEYYCKKCKKDFELRRPMSEANAPANCPDCGSTAQKLTSVFASGEGYKLRVPEKPAYRQR